MPVGAQFFNDDNVLQIDETFLCLAFRQRGHIDLGSDIGRDAIVSFNFSGEKPVPCIKVNGSYECAGIENYSLSGNTYTVNVRVTGSTGAVSLDWFVFDRPQPEVDRCGAEIYDAGGGLIFSGNSPLMNIVGEAGDYLPAGRAYAFWGPSNLIGYLDVDVDVDTFNNPVYSFRYNQYRTGAHAVAGETSYETNAGVLFIAGPGTGGYQDGIINANPIESPYYIIDVTGL